MSQGLRGKRFLFNRYLTITNNLGFVYCKKVLGNTYTGEYGNSPSGVEGLNQTINNIVATLKQGGIFCAVEKVGSFAPFIEQAGFNLLRVCQIRRGEIDARGSSISSTRIENCMVCLCQKS